MTRIALLSTSDTDLLSARSSGADFALANPSRLDVEDALPTVLADADLVVVRLLGSVRSWQDGFDIVLGAGLPVVVLGGEQTPDAELMSHSTVPVGTAAEAHRYLAEGGPREPRQPARLPLRHRPAHRRGVRAAGRPACLGVGRARHDRIRPAQGRRPVLPSARGERQQRLRPPAGGRDRRHWPGSRRSDLQLVPALRARRPLRGTRRPRCPHRHGARGRRHHPGIGERRRRRRGLGRRADEGARHPDPAGPVPDVQPRGVGGVRRGRDAARLGQPDRHPRVRRPHHHRPVLVQGDRRGRAAALRRRSRALRPGGRHRRQPRAAAPRAAGRAQGRVDAVGVSHQAQPGRQRGRARHPRLGHPSASTHARGRLRPRARGR